MGKHPISREIYGVSKEKPLSDIEAGAVRFKDSVIKGSVEIDGETRIRGGYLVFRC